MSDVHIILVYLPTSPFLHPDDHGESQCLGRGLGLMMVIGAARPEQIRFEFDGINVTGYAGGRPASVLGVSLGVDAVEEFSVLTENAPARYGRISGGAIADSGPYQ
jgi:hypothetical protein